MTYVSQDSYGVGWNVFLTSVPCVSPLSIAHSKFKRIHIV